MKPAYFRISPVNIKGQESHRLMVVLRTKGCEYARNNSGGCTVCGFMNHARPDITGKDMANQLDYILETTDMSSVNEIDLLTLGSFLNDNEVSQDARCMLLEKISQLEGILRVSVESRAEYVTVNKLNEIKWILGNKILEFGIGLESADDYIRNQIIKKGLSKRSYEKVVKMVKEADCDLLTYLLIKPPHLSEQAAIEDAVNSVKYVFETAAKYGVSARAALEPVFICENTLLEDLFLNSRYRLVNLWSVVEVIQRTHHYGSIFVGLSDESLSFNRMPNSCGECNKDIQQQIENFNRTQDISVLDKLYCECKEQYRHERVMEII